MTPPPATLTVLHLLRVINPEGAGVQTWLANAAAAMHGSDARLAAGGLWPGKPPAYICDLRHMGQASASRWRNLLHFWRWLRRDIPRMDVVHIHNVFGPVLLLGAWRSWRSRVPFVVSPHGKLVDEALASMDWRHRLYLRLVVLPIFRRAACIVVTTESDLAALRRLDHRLRISVIPPGLDMAPQDLPSTPASAGLRIAFLGRLIAVKDVPTLLQAIALLVDRGLNVTADIIGWSADRTADDLKQLAHDLAIAERVTFHGRVHGPRKDDLLRGAHVVAVPSLRENFSFVTAESLALGVPVAVSTSIGLAPVVARYGCGATVRPGDATAWADALQRFTDARYREQAACKALQCAREQFSLTAMREALVRTYRNAVVAA